MLTQQPKLRGELISEGTPQKASALDEVFSSLVSATLFTERERGDADIISSLSDRFTNV